MMFRDRTLSDLIGFSYSGMDPEHAAQDLLDRIRRIGEAWTREGQPGDPVVPIILDGENAWEHFREGGRVFLRRFYAGLQADPTLRAVTMSEAVAAGTPRELPRVFAGSWIHADFSVWIGHADDRRAWDLLGITRDTLTAVEGEGRASPEALARAWEAFRAACGSDWTWWYGEDHSSENDFEFDRLFRRHLRAVYESLGLPVPGGPLRDDHHHAASRGPAEPARGRGHPRPRRRDHVTRGVGRRRAASRAPDRRDAPRSAGRARGALRQGRARPEHPGGAEHGPRCATSWSTAEVVVSFPGPEGLRYRVRRDGRAAAWSP